MAKRLLKNISGQIVTIPLGSLDAVFTIEPSKFLNIELDKSDEFCNFYLKTNILTEFPVVEKQPIITIPEPPATPVVEKWYYFSVGSTTSTSGGSGG